MGALHSIDAKDLRRLRCPVELTRRRLDDIVAIDDLERVDRGLAAHDTVERAVAHEHVDSVVDGLGRNERTGAVVDSDIFETRRHRVHAVPAGFEYVAIHDGARPLITTEAIDHAIDVLVSDRSLDGVVCGQPAIDTLKIVDGDNIVETPPRELYWAAQTPQIFSVDAMKRAHAAAIAEGFIGTDDSSLVERMGGRVRCVQSPRDNLKVTVPEDLRPVTAILLGRMAEGEDLPHVQ